MTIVYNDQQEAAMSSAQQWWRTDSRTHSPFIWQGYAGTGKTTSIREALNRLQIPIERVALVTPTNRAAKVATEKSGIKAHTLHSLMFKTSADEADVLRETLYGWEDAHSFMQAPGAKVMTEGNPDEFRYTCEIVVSNSKWYYDGNELPEETDGRAKVFDAVREVRIKNIKKKLREIADNGLQIVPRNTEELISTFDIIVADEASMINADMGRHIGRIGLPVVYAGDPFQLPPVNAKCFWEGKAPNAMLTKIERQRGEGAGIPIAGQEIREGRKIIEGDGMHIHARNQGIEFYDTADIILAGTHRTRRRMNAEIRKHRGFTDVYPVPGEQVVSFSNYRKLGITNGEVYTVKKCRVSGRVVFLDVVDPFGKLIEEVPCWERIFRDEGDMDFTDQTLVKMTYGYCITVHKGQGSEWDHVIVCDDWSKSSPMYPKWLYTAITRASKKCDLVR